jgi:adenine-specific DNA-methyltransferase
MVTLQQNPTLAPINKVSGYNVRVKYKKAQKEFKNLSAVKTVADTQKVFKPIQYLGAKHRPLSMIMEKATELIQPGTYVLDLFSGSSVVSQSFNLRGMDVVSNDALRFNSVFASALLNIDRADTDVASLAQAIELLRNYQLSARFTNPFQELIQRERALLAARKTRALIELYRQIIQVDKAVGKKKPSENAQVRFIINNVNKSAIGKAPLIVNYYAGTYFGIYQSLELDRLRNGIENLFTSSNITKWQYNLLLTCLLNVSSKIVYSAGKHFAQPIKRDNILKKKVLLKRFHDDRQHDVWTEFEKSIKTLTATAQTNFNATQNISYSKTMEEIVADTSCLPPTSVIYADPPYTAQQYSRFYHIPEVIFDYKYPALQLEHGKATSGLYPDNKFKSRFCSKREVVDAFKDLFLLTTELKSSLMISYSASLSEETGNSRMIDLDQILELGRTYMPTAVVEIVKFDFDYRQLNASENINNSKEDKEFLIVFRK